MLDVETTTRYWDGDLEHFSGRVSYRPGQLAGMVVAEGGEARCWLNLTHCRQQDRPLIWLRMQLAATRRACTLLWASDLAVLAADDRQELGA